MTVNDSLSINGLANGMQSRYLTNAYSSVAGMDSGSLGDAPLFSFGNQGAYGQDSAFGMGMMGGGMYGGMGMGMMGGMYGQNPTQYIQYQKQMNQGNNELMNDNERYQVERQVSRQKLTRSAQFATGASEGEIDERIKVLKTCIEENEQVHVKEQYAKLLDAVKSMYPQREFASNEEKMAYDSQIKAYANRLYAAKAGQDIESSLDQYGDSQLVHGIKKGLDPFNFFTDEVSATDNKANVTDTGLSKTNISDRRTGKAIGYAGLALATGALVFGIPFALKGGGKGLGKMFGAWGRAWANLGKPAVEATEKTALKTATAVA